MTKSSVSQDESLLLPPESREPCRKPAASAGEVSVFCSCCCISPSDCGSQRGPLTAGPGRGDVHTLPPQGTGTQPDPSGHSPAARPGARWGCCCWSCCRSPSCGARARARAGLRARARQAPGSRGGNGPHPRPTARGCRRLRTRTPDLPGRPQPVGTHTSSRRRWRQGRGGGKTHLWGGGGGARPQGASSPSGWPPSTAGPPPRPRAGPSRASHYRAGVRHLCCWEGAGALGPTRPHPEGPGQGRRYSPKSMRSLWLRCSRARSSCLSAAEVSRGMLRGGGGGQPGPPGSGEVGGVWGGALTWAPGSCSSRRRGGGPGGCWPGGETVA